MKDQTCVVYVHKKQGLIAGLSWQPLISKRFFSRVAEIRRNALMVDCNLYAKVISNKLVSGGFDDYDEAISKIERTEKPFSFAAVMAKAFGERDTLIAWRIRTGPRLGDLALVVIEKGLPTLDVMGAESEVLGMMEYYQNARDRNNLFHVVSNDSKLWVADAHIEDELEFVKKHLGAGSRIHTIPLDYKFLLQATVGIFLLLGALIGYDRYLVEKQKRELAAQIALSDNTAQYAKALGDNLGRVGLTTPDYIRLLNSIYDLPYYVNGWSMQGISCTYMNCVMSWQSVGGYTDQLSEVFQLKDGYLLQINKQRPELVTVSYSFKLNLSGPPVWSELPTKAKLDEWALMQRQVYTRSKAKIDMFAEPEVWPTGYVNVPLEQAVTRYRFNVKSGVAVAESFIQNQNQIVYWDGLKMNFISAQSSGTEIELELQGAYYAY